MFLCFFILAKKSRRQQNLFNRDYDFRFSQKKLINYNSYNIQPHKKIRNEHLPKTTMTTTTTTSTTITTNDEDKPHSIPTFPAINGAIVVFAKVPHPGTSKTRLSPLLGADGAASLAQAMLSDILISLTHCVSEWMGGFPFHSIQLDWIGLHRFS